MKGYMSWSILLEFFFTSDKSLDAITHKTVDHFLSLLLVFFFCKDMFHQMWKRDVSEAFRRFCPNIVLCIVWARRTRLGVCC